LAWTTPIQVSRVVLYDRPNANDQITAATLTFADGSTVTVPALDNGGAAVTVTFPSRTTSAITLTVTTVSGTTANVGLSEFQVWAV
jgi:hypothetical protein